MRSLLRLLSFIALLFGFFVFIAISIGILRLVWRNNKPMKEAHVEVVDLSGIIISSARLLGELDSLEEDENVKAVVLRINSPGGLVAPSQEIYNALLRLDGKKPVVTSMGSVAASGGYYCALGARKIFANPGTLTASIGVIMEFANTQKLYQWAKVERYALKSGKFKDIGTPLREMTKEERDLLEGMLGNIHTQFRDAVKSRRKLADNELLTVTDGRIMTGAQAHVAKLVDELGGVDEAIADAKKLAQLPEDAPVNYPASRKGLLRRIFVGDDDPEESTTLSSLLKLAAALTTPAVSSGYRVWLLSPVR